MEETRRLSELAALLKAKYSKYATIERLFYPDDPLPIEQCYLNLAMIEDKNSHAQKDTQDNTREKIRDYFLRSYERIHHSQHKFTPEQLLSECQHIPKRIYIEGAAGAGKTTLSQFIAYQWANNHSSWQQYEFVFRFRLRNLTINNYKEDDIWLMDAIEKECFGRGHNITLTNSEKLFLEKHLKKDPKKVLFILDGYDELTYENDAVKMLWESIIYSDYDFMVTSRSGAQKASIKPNLQVAILSFDDQQVETYINYFFDPQNTPDVKSEDAGKCLQTFRQNPNLWSLAHTPIQLELLCSIWGEELQQKADITLTQIYTLMYEQLLKRYEQKRLKQEENKEIILCDIDVELLLGKMAIAFEFLENLAFDGMERNEIVISSSIIGEAYKRLSVKPKEKAAFFSILKTLGFIARDSNGRQMEFIHLTFQEYFAARYIARCFKLQQAPTSYATLSEFIRSKKYHQRYEIVWWFVAGLLKNVTEPLNNYFHLLESGPYDLVEIYQFNLQLYCLAECDLQVKEKNKNNLLQKLEDWVQTLSLGQNSNPLAKNFNIPTKVMNQTRVITALATIINNNNKEWQFDSLSNLPESILKQMIELINEKNTATFWVREALCNQAVLPESIIQQLVCLLLNEETANLATMILSHQDTLPTTILNQLLKLLKDKNARCHAADILSNQIKLPEPIIQHLNTLLTNTITQKYAVRALSGQNPLSDSLLQQISNLLDNKITQEYAVNALYRQTTLPEPILNQLVGLFHPDKDVSLIAADILSTQIVLPASIRQRVFQLLNDKNTQVYAASALSGQKALPESVLHQLVNLLSEEKAQTFAAITLFVQTTFPRAIYERLVKLIYDKNIGKFAAWVLSGQIEFSDPILQQLVSLLSRNDVDTQEKVAEALSYQITFPDPVLKQLCNLLNSKNTQRHVAKVLSGQRHLSKDMLIAISQIQESSNNILECIESIPIAYLCARLNHGHWEELNKSLLKLIILKCLKQKVALYFYDNQLYVGGESQGEFSDECRKQITQILEQLFTDITGIPATIKNNDKDYLHNLDQITQFSGDSVMEDKNSSNTNMIRETITLKVKNLNSAIVLIEDQLLQDRLTLLLDKCIKKATTLNNAALNNVAFCKQRDTHIQMLQEEAKEVSTSDELSEEDKSIALDQILPDLIFPFWCCRPYLKIETEDGRAQNLIKEQQLFNEQKVIRIKTTFIQALNEFKESRKAKQSRKPKLYFMYAWPVHDYAQRESGIQDFLGNLRQDLNHAGIEAIFGREDNFSGNNLAQFMGQILHEHAIVLVLGTESFRYKWFGHKTALQVEGDLLKLKWLTDFSEGNIQSNQKTTIIPLVLTGIRETAIPEDLLPAKNPTVRALCNLSYQQIISLLLAVAYGITEPAVAKYFNDKPDHTIAIDPPRHSAPTHYSAIQQQTLFGRVNYPLRNNNNIETQAIASSFTSMEIEEESNPNVPK